ncbi:MAG: iron-containing alcohol dehydrogenase [Myxococcota bacterium]|nr:iron-containing alcohol dehydrogenase [Myxococcota bacterium]
MDINAIIDDLLTRYHKHLDTRAILIAEDALRQAPALLSQHLPEGTWLVGVDAHTWEAAGKDFTDALTQAGIAWERYDIADRPGHGHPVCDDVSIAALSEHLAKNDYAATVAVGSGTINDIVKFAATEQGLLAACVGTAPSMNGYTSKIAAILSDGVKTTNPCQAPVVVIADLDVMATSPARMIASGLGDLISKPVSNADWQLSAELNGSFHSAEAMEVIETGAAMLDGVAPKLQKGDREAMAGLLGSLMLSGLAMSIAGSSSPASGGEHLISHFIDMTAHAFDEPYDFHGCQVGVGTLTTAHFYEQLAKMDPASIDVDARVAALSSWEDYDAMLAERFGKLHGPVRKHAEQAYPTPEELRARLTLLKQNWSTILERVQRTLRTKDSIEEELRQADAPVRFADLDVARDRARRSIAHSKDIRNRYTILHLAWELGTIDTWTEQALELLYDA